LPPEGKRKASSDVAYVCHEIRNSLVVIGGYARQILRGEQLDEKNKEKLHIILNEVAGLETFLSDVTRAAKNSENEP
jgi:signal transduction histidine kinase